MKTILTVLLMVTFSGFVMLPAAANAELSPEEILVKSDDKRGNMGGIEFVLYIDSIEAGRTHKRTLRVKARGRSALVAYITPAKMKGTRILRLGRNMWLAKPGLRKPFAISSRQRLLGQASNGDVTTTDYAGDYRAVSVTNVMLGATPCYLLDLKAVDKQVTYDRIRYWVSKNEVRAVKAEFLTVSGRLIKTATFEYKNTLTVQGQSFKFLSKMVITSAISKSNVTTLIYSKVQFKKHPDSTFNRNLLLR
jgi:outer membrane lipoprotein-sorting protein